MSTLSLPVKFSASFINRIFFNREWRYKDLADINSGRCYDWAYIAYCLWSDVVLWTTDMHAWVQVNGKFYDSESKFGHYDHSELNCNSMWPPDDLAPTIMSVRNFKSFWNEHGGGATHHWPDLYRKMRAKGLNPVRR